MNNPQEKLPPLGMAINYQDLLAHLSEITGLDTNQIDQKLSKVVPPNPFASFSFSKSYGNEFILRENEERWGEIRSYIFIFSEDGSTTIFNEEDGIEFGVSIKSA
ncbi:hypothetical protein GF354_01880 [Candidatus Peregrinibacteria bacterium]|nr:hypothetical protein [Candidatus Peregrinibacteria bacterium]